MRTDVIIVVRDPAQPQAKPYVVALGHDGPWVMPPGAREAHLPCAPGRALCEQMTSTSRWVPAPADVARCPDCRGPVQWTAIPEYAAPFANEAAARAAIEDVRPGWLAQLEARQVVVTFARVEDELRRSRGTTMEDDEFQRTRAARRKLAHEIHRVTWSDLADAQRDEAVRAEHAEPGAGAGVVQRIVEAEALAPHPGGGS